jgi:hypothetical protein
MYLFGGVHHPYLTAARLPAAIAASQAAAAFTATSLQLAAIMALHFGGNHGTAMHTSGCFAFGHSLPGAGPGTAAAAGVGSATQALSVALQVCMSHVFYLQFLFASVFLFCMYEHFSA